MNTETLRQIVDTLKQIDVRGYDSMNRLVAVVSFIENVIVNAENNAQKEAQEDGAE